jgi:nucleoside phosphorylase
MSDLLVDIVLVPAGFEHLIVRASIGLTLSPSPVLLSIPMGPVASANYLRKTIESGTFFKPASNILLIGLAGGLSPDLRAGDRVLIEECGSCHQFDQFDQLSVRWLSFDHSLFNSLIQILPAVKSGRLITTDSVVCESMDKLNLWRHSGADVVDMEGFIALKLLSESGHHVSILRVISDDSHHDLPDIESVVSASGSLVLLPLVLSFLRRPRVSIRFIGASLTGLFSLFVLTAQLFGSKSSRAA